ncbi:hypothetical protein PIB30_052037 [Stylosanthes scabra]|uniref:Uncharacterized protein n=1 Tax=Stylosanthes scabra TaxID=79078 RepID=A0ABU6RIG1_9FABA|nr:hypothetical protein [Stylosanthes scabra]
MENINKDTENDANSFTAIRGSVEEAGGGSGDSGGTTTVDDVALKKGPWTAAEDAILVEYVTKHGEGNWNAVQRNTELARCGKSCRLRWANHLRPNLKKGAFSPEEEKLIIELHAQFGNKWARMAALLPGRTDNEIKNYWNTRIKRRQRQGLPLYSDDPDRPTIATTPTTPITHPITNFINNNNNSPTPKFEFLHQNYLHSQSPHHHHHHHLNLNQNYSPLNSPLHHHRAPSYSPRPFLDATTLSSLSFSAHSPLSTSLTSSLPLPFTFQRPAPLLCNPLRFKRFRSTPDFNLTDSSNVNPTIPTTAHLFDIDNGFRFPVHLNSPSSFSHFFQNPSLLDLERNNVNMVSSTTTSSPSNFQCKMELPSNQIEPLEVKLDVEYNDLNSLNTNNGLVGDILLSETQNFASGNQVFKKRNYLSLNEGHNEVFDGCQSFDDSPLSSLYWPSASGQQDWQHNNTTEIANNVDDNFGVDIKPPEAGCLFTVARILVDTFQWEMINEWIGMVVENHHFSNEVYIGPAHPERVMCPRGSDESNYLLSPQDKER